MSVSWSQHLGGVLLVAGTAIGAGILALPVVLGPYGFWVGCGLLLLCWAVMLLAAFYMLEVALWLPPGSNLISMAQATLGRFGRLFAWSFYLALLYVLMSAYLSGLHGLLRPALTSVLGQAPPFWLSSLGLMVVCGAVVSLGTRMLDRLNRGLMLGLVATFIGLVWQLGSAVHWPAWQVQDWPKVWRAVPVVVTAYGFQIVIPSLRCYLVGEVTALRRVLWLGGMLPLLAYLLWLLVTLGVLPARSLPGLVNSSQPAVDLVGALQSTTRQQGLAFLAHGLSFFAIATSFLGVTLSLFDCLADGCGRHFQAFGRLPLIFLTFVPPIFFVMLYPNGFLLALGYAGSIVAVLLGLLPALMVWRGRPRYAVTAHYQVPGGIWAVFGLVLLSMVVMVCEWHALG